MKVGVIMNPVAGGGRQRKAWPQIAAMLAGSFAGYEMRETEEPGDAAALAREFAGEGFDLVIAAGGDGTISEVADGLLQIKAEAGTRTALGILPCGTGADFARGLEIPQDAGASVRRIAAGNLRQLDAGRVSFINDDGRLMLRHFVNIASLGISGAIDRAVNAEKRRGAISAKGFFLWRTVIEFLRYRFEDVRIAIDDGEPFEARMALVAVANGKFFGGGMMIAPDAEPDDGQFDIVVLRAAGKLGLIRDIRLLYGGRHRDHPAITILRGRKVTVEPIGAAANAPLIDIDGESPGRGPATFEILPGALTVKC
ncbi:MAG: diacylglycerol kinase family lipid kinase [Pseudaminobacter sp.]|nr:diacylglycerol kinase family lipid kinase [Pseudaminobacter sp.]